MDHAQLAELILHYGYLAVLIGSLMEGETVLIMAGFAAHRGYLDLPLVIAIGALGGFLGDQFFFIAGRRRGRQLLARFPTISLHAARIQSLIERNSAWLVLGVRFMYGLRIAGPILIGMSNVSHWRFVVLNALGAALWASLFGGAGFVFGHGIELVLAHARRYEFYILAAILAVGLVAGILRKRTDIRKVKDVKRLPMVGVPGEE